MSTKRININGQDFEVSLTPIYSQPEQTPKKEVTKKESGGFNHKLLLTASLVLGLLICKILGIGASCPLTAWMF